MQIHNYEIMSVTRATFRLLMAIFILFMFFIAWPITGFILDCKSVITFLPWIVIGVITLLITALYQCIPWVLDDLPELVRDIQGKKINRL